MKSEPKKELITGQELIAEFMQLKSFEDGRYGKLWSDPFGKNQSNFSLQYNTSWDWLMPVVHKILKTTEPEKGGWSYEYIELEKTRVGNSIDYVYMKVVEFIKRHNSQRGN